MTIGFVLSSIDRGGAERQMFNLASGLADRGHAIVIYVVQSGGKLEADFRSAGLEIVPLCRSSLGALLAPLRLARDAQARRLDVVHGYMVAGNILAGMVSTHGRSRAVFGIRGIHPAGTGSVLLRMAHWVEARLAHKAAAVIANSEAAARHCTERGFPPARTVVIHNGIDIKCFQLDREARSRLRAEWGWGDRELVVGRVARFADSKDFPTFVKAAALAARQDDSLRFVCIGDGVDRHAASLRGLADHHGLDADRLRFFPGRDDVEAVMSALDLHVLSSSAGDSFPNVVCETMACGVPNVVTDVGAAADIVGESGIVVPVRDPERMAVALLDLARALRHDTEGVREGVRRRIAEAFPVSRMVDHTEEALLAITPRNPTDGST